MSKSVDELFFNDLKTRDFFIGKEVSNEVIDQLIDDNWKGYSIAKRDLVYQAMIVGFECANKKGNLKEYVEEEIKNLRDGKRGNTVDLGQLSSFLDRERGVVALSLLLTIFDIDKVSQGINDVFLTLRVLAELGLQIIKKEVIDEKISIYRRQMEKVFSLPELIRKGEVDCSL
jgi:hypothetical protein